MCLKAPHSKPLINVAKAARNFRYDVIVIDANITLLYVTMLTWNDMGYTPKEEQLKGNGMMINIKKMGRVKRKHSRKAICTVSLNIQEQQMKKKRPN